jgi:hypothetical protein
VRPSDLAALDLLIVGGPTQRHRASPALAAWLEGLGRRTLSGVPAATPESFFIERDQAPSGEKRRHDLERLELGETECAAAWAVGLLRSLDLRPGNGGTLR